MKIATASAMMLANWMRPDASTKIMFLQRWILITACEFFTGSYDRTVRIFPYNGGHSGEIYHTKRMQRVFCVKFSCDVQVTSFRVLMTPIFGFGKQKHLNSWEFYCQESVKSMNAWKPSRTVTSIFLRSNELSGTGTYLSQFTKHLPSDASWPMLKEEKKKGNELIVHQEAYRRKRIIQEVE